MHNMIPLKEQSKDWAVVSYEQAVLQPAPLIEYICKKLELLDENRIHKRLNIPSRSTVFSDDETRDMLAHTSDDRTRLVTKWRSRVTVTDLRETQDILDAFNIDYYRADQFIPNREYWIGTPAEELSYVLLGIQADGLFE